MERYQRNLVVLRVTDLIQELAAMARSDPYKFRLIRSRLLAGALVTLGLSATNLHARSTPAGQPGSPLGGLTRIGGSDIPHVDPGIGPGQTEPLSKKLDRDEGVITPPGGVDSEIKKPTPKDFRSDMQDT